MKINVLYITSTLTRSGPVNQLFNIVSNLDRSLYNPMIVTLSPETDDSLINRFIKGGISVKSLDLSRVQGMFLAKTRLRRIISEFKPAIIHTQGLRADVLSSKITCKAKKIATIRNYPQIDFVMTYGKLLGRLYAYYQISALKRMDRCVGVSASVKNNLIRSFNLNNVEHILNGVRVDKYYPVDNEVKQKTRRELGLDSADFIFLTSLGKDSRKNGALIAKASALLNVHKHIKFIFIEEGTQYNICKEITSGNENIIYAGRVSNVEDYMHASDVYISASLAEGLPNAVLEALSTGLPVILSDIGPHLEIMEKAPKATFTFEKHNVKDLVSKIQHLKNSVDFDKLKNQSRNYACNNFSAEFMSNEYQKLYYEMYKD